jgi:uncharacterized membrane protein YhaH (DUF805 family)
MLKWYKKVMFENFANFSGRARRAEYWYFVLMYIILLIVATMLDGALGLNFSPLPYGYLYLAVALASIIPSLAAGVRRMHDVGKSGWFLLIPIYSLVLACSEGNRGENRYGADPKATEE